MSISPVLDGLDEFDSEETTEITKVESANFTPKRRRRPGDGRIERILLERPPGAAAVTFCGPSAASEADLILDAWARHLKRGAEDTVQFTVHFGDGFAYRSTLHIRKSGQRDLLSFLRAEKNFRAAFCPELTKKEASHLFHVFRTSYDLSGTRAEMVEGFPADLAAACAA